MSRIPYRHPHGDDRSYYREYRPPQPRDIVVSDPPANEVALYGPKGEPLRYRVERETVPFGFQPPEDKT